MWVSAFSRTSSWVSPPTIASQSGWTDEHSNAKGSMFTSQWIAVVEATPVVLCLFMDDLKVGRFIIPAAELDESFETSGGPGGQHANRNETAVRLRFDIDGSSLPDDVRSKLRSRIGDHAEVVAADSRSQFRNRALARQRLQEKLEKALVDPAPRKKTRPTRASQRRRIEDKRARSKKKRLRQPPDFDG